MDGRDSSGSGTGLQATGLPVEPRPHATKTSVLIAEEEEHVRQVEASCFERIGCIVHSTRNLAQALEEARTSTIDIAVVSEGILGGDCARACRALREATGRSDLPILLISDEDLPEALDVERACGCSDYVPRSVAQMELVRRVANLLQIPPRRFLRTMVALAQPSTRARVEYLGHSRDISRTGILIETPRPLAIDEVLPIKFLLPHSNALINATARVTRVLRNPMTGQYEIGCRFIEIDASARLMIEDFLTQDSDRD